MCCILGLKAAGAMVLLSLLTVAHALAPLEPADGKVHWRYPLLLSNRLAVASRNLSFQPSPSFHQVSLTIGGTLGGDGGPITENNRRILNFKEEMDAMADDVVLYLTVDPLNTVDEVTEAMVERMAREIKEIMAGGRKVFLRYAHEMNGPWLGYGGRPATYIPHFRSVVTTVRRILGPEFSQRIAMVWAPNSCNGYPFGGATNVSKEDFDLLDTNKDGKLDGGDNPFSPFYPGDEYVDWTGLSMYDYGSPKYSNSLTQPGMFEGMINGEATIPVPDRSNWQPCGFDFYDMFSGGNKLGQAPASTKSDRPLMVAETGKAQYLEEDGRVDPGPGEVEMKRGYPKLKGICFFDILKFESSEGRGQLRQYQTTNTTNGVVDALVEDLVALQSSSSFLLMGGSPKSSSTTSASAPTFTGTVTTATGTTLPSASNTTAGIKSASERNRFASYGVLAVLVLCAVSLLCL
ncbi:glycoside hydrolase superfamily [Chytridium lagenaria]|nr:glycoside hydrolase superfamily [Chytridium lagenaria]